MKKLFIGNIAWSATKEDLKAFFEEIGPVEDAFLVYDRERGRHKGFGFITYVNAEDAERAMKELDGKDFQGREIRISAAREQGDDAKEEADE